MRVMLFWWRQFFFMLGVVGGGVLPGWAAEDPAALARLLVPADGSPWWVDENERAVYLAGSHDGWELQDFAWGDTLKESPFAWQAFLDFLSSHHHNVIRLWVVEHTKINEADADLTSPMPYMRRADAGLARDGLGKFDLDQFNPTYFERLRDRVAQARARGLYVIVMLFQGWSVEDKGGKVNPWPYHPFHRDNNVNGVDGDVDGDGQGEDLHTWLGEDHEVTRRQRSYLRRVVETVHRFDNVLYEVANESHTESLIWQNHVVDFVRAMEGSLGVRHPVGITVPFGGARRGGLNRELFQSRADWISPNREAGRGFNYRDDPPAADGRKVVLLDSDHLHGNRLRDYRWVWKAFCRGHHVLFMDRWTEEPRDPLREEVRLAIGQTVRLAERMNLRTCRPDNARSSTGYCLAAEGKAVVVFQPQEGRFSVAVPESAGAAWLATWIHPVTGETRDLAVVAEPGPQEFQPPFANGSVLWLRSSH